MLLTIIAQAEQQERPQDEAFEEAWRLLTEKNPLPAVCARVCPHPCEGECNRLEKDCAVAVNNIERFLGDWAISGGLRFTKLTEEVQPERIAVVGSGPSGLSCAYHLARRGYKVTIFEAFRKAGGMLRYGIPAYRLPRQVLDAEIQRILDLGVDLRLNVAVGKDVTLDELRANYDSIFLGIGAQNSAKLHCPGEDSCGVFSGLEFLRLVNSGEEVDIGQEVVVIGGGNTAIDAARVARRLKARVTLLYRRTRVEMPATQEEISGAEEEGVNLHFLAAPVEIESRGGRILQLVCQRMTLGEPDDSGRRSPVPILSDTFSIPADSIIVAVSQQPDWAGLEDLLSAYRDRENIHSGLEKWDGVLAGGDVEKVGIVAEALAQGRQAAEAMHARFRGIALPPATESEVVRSDRLNLQAVAPSARHDVRLLPVEDRLRQPWSEIKSSLSTAEVIAEAKRCINCGESFIKHPKTHPVHLLRRVSQFGIGTLLLNSYFAVFSAKTIYAGPLRSVCVPGLNCHACPTATMGCPIGMMQHFSATHRFPWFLLGFLGIIGLISGRFTCGWLCPWGFVQDMVYRFKKLMVRIPRLLIYFKYVVLVGLVVIIPYMTYEHSFSKLCPCGALIAGIPWVLWNPVDPVVGLPTIEAGSVGTLFTVKMLILGAFLLLFLFIKRPFCRTVCPLGAMYAVFNRMSLVSVRVGEGCADCGQCRAVCPTDLEVRTQVNSEACIKCLECTQCQHVKFKWNWPWKSTLKAKDTIRTRVVPAMQPTAARSHFLPCHSSCIIHHRPATISS